MKNSDCSPVIFDYPNPKRNVFVMMRFCESKQHQEIFTIVKEALEYYGLKALRADDKSYSDSLWNNVKSYMDACEYGIAIFEQIKDDDINPNICLEIGYMMSMKKPLLLLIEKQVKLLPADILGNLYKPFDSYDIKPTIRPKILGWLKDIGIAKSTVERVILFVSYGGTCRCAMAKVALEQTLKRRQLPYEIRIISVAHKFGETNEASRGARRAVFKSYGSDLT